MKYKTSKLAKLERSRKSILTDNLSNCYLCGQSPVDIHEIYGGCNRIVSIKNDFCIPLCRKHHRQVTDNIINDIELKQLCQRKFEETHTRDEFLRLIGRNYLE